MSPGRPFTGARTPRFALLAAAAALVAPAGCMTSKSEKLPKTPAKLAAAEPALQLPKPSNVDATPAPAAARPAGTPTPVSVRRPEPQPVGPATVAPGYTMNSMATPDGNTSGAGGLTVAAGPERVPPNAATMTLTPAASTAGRGPLPPPPPAMPTVPPPVTAGELPAPEPLKPTDRNAGTNAGGIAVPTSVGPPKLPEPPDHAASTVAAPPALGIPPER